MSEQTLRRKLFLAAKEAEAVDKKGDSEDGTYKFARAKDVLAEANRVLAKRGVVVLPSVEDVKLSFGQSGTMAKVSMTFEICDSQTEETITKAWSGTGWDFPGDKAIYAAITGAKKYFFASLLSIPFGVDPEGDGEAEDSASSEAQRIAAEQDRAAEQPDVPAGQGSNQGQAPSPESDGAAAPATAPAPGSVPAESIEAEYPADAEGLE